MNTSRIFIGDICIGNRVVKSRAVLIYYPGRGYLDYERIIGSFINLRILLGKFDKLFMGTTIDLHDKYVNRETLRHFDYDNISSLKRINDDELKLVIDKFKHKKSNL